jgi:hypothetical protein
LSKERLIVVGDRHVRICEFCVAEAAAIIAARRAR